MTEQRTVKQAHLVVCPRTGWGHIRSILQLGLSFLPASPAIHLTCLCTPDTYDDMSAELERQNHLPSDVRRRIQCVEIKPMAVDDGVLSEWEDKMPGFERAMMSLMGWTRAGKGSSENVGEGFEIVPSVIIHDHFPYSIARIMRALSERLKCPYVHCVYFGPAPATAMLRLSNRDDLGGRLGGFLDRYEQYRKMGMSESEAGQKAYQRIENVLLDAPDLPKMYDYELHPLITTQPFSAAFPMKVASMERIFVEDDGFIIIGVPEIEPWATEQMQKSIRMPLYPVGPQLDQHAWDENAPTVRKIYNPAEKGILDFLDEAVGKYGKRCMAFVSLGSVMWPSLRPELIQYLVESLLDAKPPLPFLFATAVKGAVISEDIRARVDKSGRGSIVPWVPQFTAMQHEAMRFFVSHCGSGSVTEAIAAELPIVAFPFHADQTLWAQLLSRKFNAGIQLHQINSGMKGKALGVGGTVHETESAIKDEMREAWNIMRDDAKWQGMKEGMKTLKDTIRESKENGQAKVARDAFVSKYLI